MTSSSQSLMAVGRSRSRLPEQLQYPNEISFGAEKILEYGSQSVCLGFWRVGTQFGAQLDNKLSQLVESWCEVYSA